MIDSLDWDLPLIAAVALFGSCGLIFLAVLHGLYFYLRYQRQLDRKLMGDRYFDAGFLYGYMQRMNLYGMALQWAWFIDRIPFIDKDRFRNMCRRDRRHILFNSWLVTVALVIMLASGSVVMLHD